MSLSAYTNTLEARVLSSDPVQLIDILYRLAIDAVEAARDAHAEGDVAAPLGSRCASAAGAMY
jgi:hypothetical protein